MAQRITLPSWSKLTQALITTPVNTVSPGDAPRVDYSNTSDRTWSIAAHAGAAALGVISLGFLGWVIPLMALLSNRSSYAPRAHAAEALNFQLSWLAVSTTVLLVGVGSSWLLFGQLYYVVAGAFIVGAAALSLLGAAAAAGGVVPHYPATFRLFR